MHKQNSSTGIGQQIFSAPAQAHHLAELRRVLAYRQFASPPERQDAILTAYVSRATVLPVQVFLWSDLPEIAFKSRTAAAIMVLLVVLFALNAAAIYLRKRFERRW